MKEHESEAMVDLCTDLLHEGKNVTTELYGSVADEIALVCCAHAIEMWCGKIIGSPVSKPTTLLQSFLIGNRRS